MSLAPSGARPEARSEARLESRPESRLEARLDYVFKKPELLRQAVTHRSHSATHNERLEFLGDSVLNCVVATLLFRRFAMLNEGDLSRVRANLVRQQTLYELAQAASLADFLRLGEGELKSGGMKRPSILADTLEAIFGAIYLDGGFDAAETAISRLYAPILAEIDPLTLGKDAKTLLQEHLQANQIALPQYVVVATHGAAHNQQFEVECAIPKLEIRVRGAGSSRRAAEQAAAICALERMTTVAPSITSGKGGIKANASRVKAARGLQGRAPTPEPVPAPVPASRPDSAPPGVAAVKRRRLLKIGSGDAG